MYYRISSRVNQCVSPLSFLSYSHRDLLVSEPVLTVSDQKLESATWYKFRIICSDSTATHNDRSWATHSCVFFFTIKCSAAQGLLYADQASGLNNKHLLFTVVEAEQSKIKVLGRACFLVCSLCAASSPPSHHFSSSFYKDVRPIMRVPPL